MLSLVYSFKVIKTGGDDQKRLKIMPTETNGAKAGKAALRNFKFTKEADDELLRLKVATGRNMTAVLEDLLLQRRQFCAPVETWLDAEAARTCRPRAKIIEQVLEERMCRDSNFPPLGVNPDVTEQEGGAGIVSVETKKEIEKQPRQIPGCLPLGYDLDSLLTVEQFALWWQVAVRTARAALPITKGVLRGPGEDVRIHPRNHLGTQFEEKIPVK